MSGFNLPPGCRESDLPGYNDIEVTIAMTCQECNSEWNEEDVPVDARDGMTTDVDGECPECVTPFTHIYTHVDYRD